MSHVSDAADIDMPEPPLSADDLDERRIEAQVEELFRRFVDKSQSQLTLPIDANASIDTDPDVSDLPAGHLRCGDLPEILREFEAMRAERQEQGGEEDVDVMPLIHPNLLPQVEAFAAQNASVGIESHKLVEMILRLQRAFDREAADSRPDTPISSASNGDGVDDSLSRPEPTALHISDDLDWGGASSDDDEQLRRRRTLASSPPPESDLSEEIGQDYSASQSVVRSRGGQSASTPARRTPALRSSSPRHRRKVPSVLDSGSGGKRTRSPNGSAGESVLLGHGKASAPPTSWTRPKTYRRGRSSEVMPPSPAMSEAESNVSHMRRSSYHASSDKAARSFSPELDDGRSMTPMTLSAMGYADASYGGSSSTAELLRENERLARARQTLERTLETKEDEHEAQIADLHSQLEAAEDNLATKKREEREAVLRAAHVADQVVSLEAELTALARRNSDLEEIHTKGREQVEELMVETENLRRQRDELRDQLASLKDSEEHERDQAEMALDEVARLKHALEERENRVSELLGLQSENEKLAQDTLALRGTVSKLKDELEERARTATFGRASGAKGRATLDGTPTRRLGAELARELAAAAAEGSGTESDSSATHGGEAGSADTSYVELVTRQYKRHAKRRAAAAYAEVGIQTDPAAKQELSGDVVERESPPPTYDEAALERAIVDRLHPHRHPAAIDEVQPQLGKWAEYIELSRQLGVRCTLLEERMHALVPSLPLGRAVQGLSLTARLQAWVAQVLRIVADLGQGRAPAEASMGKLGRVGVHVGWAVILSVFLLGMLVAHLSFSSGTVQIGPFSSSHTDFAAAHALFAPAGATQYMAYELPSRHWLGTNDLRNYHGTTVPF